MLWVLLVGLATLALAFFVAVVAEDRGQAPLPWFVLALFLPLISLLVLLVAFPRQPIPPRPTADDAVATSAVARALAEAPERSSVHQLVERTGLSEREVLAQLRALTHLGRVTRDDSGRFELTAVRPDAAPAGP